MMKKALKKIWGWIRVIVLFLPTMLWWTGLFVCGIVVQMRITRTEYPTLRRIEAFNLLDLDKIAAEAFAIVAEKCGRPDVKLGS